MPTANVDGSTLHYTSDGDERAPPLVFANSLGADHTMWDPQVPALSKHFRVIRYDARGHGESAVTPGPYSVERLGRDVVALLDHLRIERAAFCGLSLGGLTGQWLGVHAGNRLTRLVLANTAPKIGAADAWNQRIAAVNAGGVTAIADAVLARWFTPAFRDREPWIALRMKAMMERQPAPGYVAQCAAVRDHDARADLGRIAVPTLVIAGTHDASAPAADGRFLAQHVPGARYVELDAAHISNVEAAAAFDAALLSFLQGATP